MIHCVATNGQPFHAHEICPHIKMQWGQRVPPVFNISCVALKYHSMCSMDVPVKHFWGFCRNISELKFVNVAMFAGYYHWEKGSKKKKICAFPEKILILMFLKIMHVIAHTFDLFYHFSLFIFTFIFILTGSTSPCSSCCLEQMLKRWITFFHPSFHFLWLIRGRIVGIAA